MKILRNALLSLLVLALVAGLAWQTMRAWRLQQQVSSSESRQAELKAELDELKHGAARLLARGKADAEAGDFAAALDALGRLLSRHPTSPEAAEAATLKAPLEAQLAQQRSEAEMAAREAAAREEAEAERRRIAKEAEERRKAEMSPGKWRVSTSTSPIDDSNRVVLMLSAETPIPDRIGSPTTPSLFVRCSENTTNVFINFGVYLGLDETSLLTRLDDAKATTRTWGISTDNEAVFAPRGEHITWARRLLQAEKLFVQVTPYGESPASTTFDLRGLKNVIEPLQQACGWR